MRLMVKKKWWLISLPIVLIVVLAGGLYYWFPAIRNRMAENEIPNQQIVEETVNDDENAEPQIAEPTSTPEISDIEELREIDTVLPTSNAPVKLFNLYVSEGEIAEFKCYFPGMDTTYIWEIYNVEKKVWEDADAVGEKSMQIDELNRNISILRLPAKKEYQDLNIRCTVQNESSESIEAQKGKLVILDDKIMSVKMVEHYQAMAGSYISSLDIPVEITFADGTTQTITGLQGLFFCIEKDKKMDVSRKNDGNTVEVVTTKTVESEYLYVDAASQEVLLRYRTDRESLEIKGTIEGIDEAPPEIYHVQISPFEVTNDDTQEIVLSIEIDAEDNFCPLPNLQYAFLPADKKITQEDWQSESIFEVTITKNGEWIAYCQDESGNYATSHKEIVAVDQKAPNIKSVFLQTEEEEWCKSNTIIVSAEDKTAMQYCFVNGSTDSGWITYSEYVVDENGTWMVKVRDEAGNVSEAEIKVSNIDKISPTIQKIEEIVGGDQ